MKKLIGRKSLIMCLVGMMVVLLGATAQASLITGGISFSGDYALNGPAATATAFSSFSNVVVQSGSLDFSAIPINTSATFTAFTFSPPSDVTPLWTVTFGGKTYSLNATGSTMAFVRESGLIPAIDVTGLGTILATGFDPTPGAYKITAQTGAGTFSFSASSIALPEPTTLILLGSGLLGLALTGAKKFRK